MIIIRHHCSSFVHHLLLSIYRLISFESLLILYPLFSALQIHGASSLGITEAALPVHTSASCCSNRLCSVSRDCKFHLEVYTLNTYINLEICTRSQEPLAQSTTWPSSTLIRSLRFDIALVSHILQALLQSFQTTLIQVLPMISQLA